MPAHPVPGRIPVRRQPPRPPLYGPVAMPTNLVQAHRQLDRAVEAGIVPSRRFNSNDDRLTA